MNGPYINDIIRLQLSKGSPPSDQVSGSTPSFYVNCDLTVALADTFLGAGIDASDVASVTLEIRPSTDTPFTPPVAVTATPSSTGWNSNAAQVAGANVVPGYAQYDANGAGASATATIGGFRGTQITGVTGLIGGSGYVAPPIILVTPTGGDTPSALAILTPVLTNGVVTSVVVTAPGGGYANVPTLTFITVPGYVLGVQKGASYNLQMGSADIALWNGNSLVTGSNLIDSNSPYVGCGTVGYDAGGNATMSGLTSGACYYWVKGANDTNIAGTTTLTATGFFIASGTTAAMVGTASAQITAQVYPATPGNNVVNGAASYPATSAIAPTGSTKVFPGTPPTNPPSGPGCTAGLITTASASGAASGFTTASIYSAGGTVTLIGLTLGATYIYILNEGDISVAGQTAQTGYFTAVTSSALLTGKAGNTVTSIVYATTEAATSFILGGLTIGQTYRYVMNETDASVIVGATTYSNPNFLTSATQTIGLFTAISQQVTLTGSGTELITTTIQPVNQTTSGSFIAASNTVTFTGVASASVTAQLTGSVGWNLMSDQLCLMQFSASQLNLATPAGGGTTTYWMLITAVSTAATGSKQIVFDAGPVSAVDAGQASGTGATGNIAFYPQVGGVGLSAASYDGSGNVTLAGLSPGMNYYWTKGAHDTSVTGTSLTASGTFTATGSPVVLTGSAGQTVTAAVSAVNTNPLVQILKLTSGQVGFTVSNLSLPSAPITAVCFVSCPPGGTPLTAWFTEGSQLSSGGSFVLSYAVPGTGTYKATIWWYI